MKLHPILTGATGLLLPLLLGAGVDAVAVLKAADRATGSVTHVQYEARAWGAEGLLNQIATVTANVKARRQSGAKHPEVFVEASVTERPDKAPFEQTLKSNGQQARLVSGSFVRVDPVGEGLHTLRLHTATMWMREYTMPNPFRDELEADIIRHEGRREIGGVTCDVIYVRYNARRGAARWYFGQEDHLPRRVDRIMGSGARVLELRKVRQPETLPDTLFTWPQPKPATNAREQMP